MHNNLPRPSFQAYDTAFFSSGVRRGCTYFGVSFIQIESCSKPAPRTCERHTLDVRESGCKFRPCWRCQKCLPLSQPAVTMARAPASPLQLLQEMLSPENDVRRVAEVKYDDWLE